MPFYLELKSFDLLFGNTIFLIKIMQITYLGFTLLKFESK